MKCVVANNSVFSTDNDRRTFRTEIKIHPEFLKDHKPLSHKLALKQRLQILALIQRLQMVIFDNR